MEVARFTINTLKLQTLCHEQSESLLHERSWLLLKSFHVNKKQPNVQTLWSKFQKQPDLWPISLVKAGKKKSKINLTSLTRSLLYPLQIPFSCCDNKQQNPKTKCKSSLFFISWPKPPTFHLSLSNLL